MPDRTRLPARALALALLVAACGGSDSSTVPIDPVGTLTVRLTDAPLQNVAAINVYVTGLSIQPTGGPAVSIASDLGAYDLLALRGTVVELASVDLTPGSYDFIRIDLDQERSNVIAAPGGAEFPLEITNEQVVVPGGFGVPADGETVVTLDFDAEASLRQTGLAEWRLTPVITQIVSGGP